MSIRLCAQVLLVLAVVCSGLASSPVNRYDLGVRAQTQSGMSDTPYLPQVSTAAGLRRLKNGHWGMVSAKVVNPTDRPVKIRVLLNFQENDKRQYGRDIWVPAHSQRMAWYPVRAPDAGDVPLTPLPVEVRIEDHTDGKAVPLRRSTEGRLRGDAVRVDFSRAMTGLLTDQLPAGARPEERLPYELVVTVRGAQQLSRKLSMFDEEFMPPVVECLEAMDQMIVASNRLGDDQAGLLALRGWVHRGGSLWIMLDKVDLAIAERLLGDNLNCQLVDEIELTDLRIESTRIVKPVDQIPLRTFEQPVRMKRMLVADADVSHKVNDWPAAFWVRFGRGRVLFTTLSSMAWMRLRTNRDPRPRNELDATAYVAVEAMRNIGHEFFTPNPPAAEDLMGPFVEEQIGYQIVSRWAIFSIMGGFVALVLGGAAWCWKQGRAERLAVLGPLAALAAAAVIIALGWNNQASVPPTVAMGQLVEATLGTDDVSVDGVMSFYSQSPVRQPLAANRGGTIAPQAGDLGNSVFRLVRNDIKQWTWERLEFSPGVHATVFRQFALPQKPLLAAAQFGEQGLSGTVDSGAFAKLSDALIATPSRRNLVVTLRDGGRFETGRNAELPAGQYLAETLLSDEQRRRQTVYRKLLDGDRPYVYEPTLLAWATLLDTDFDLPPHEVQRGGALLSIPIHLRRTPPNQTVFVPPAFIPYRAAKGPNGKPASSVYNHRRREWLVQQTPAEVHFRFQLPAQVVPLKIRQATVRFQAKCPTRNLTIWGFTSAGQPVQLAQYKGPSTPLTLQITNPDVLQLDAAGGLLLGMYVDYGDTPENDTTWQFQSLQMHLTGQTQAVAVPAAP